MAARAMHHTGASCSQQISVSWREIIHVDCAESGLEQTIFMSEFHRRTFAAIGHVSLAFQPIIERTRAIGEHPKFVFRLREMRRDREVVLEGISSSFADQFGGC